jgi:isopenicillin-N N-acyltransferase-like protein
MFRKILNIIHIGFEVFLFALISFIFFIVFSSQITPPVSNTQSVPKRIKINDNHYVVGANWLKKNKFGIWEMYLEGKPYERGITYGVLAKELIQYQEEVFVNQINTLVPSESWQQVVRLLIGFFNKDLVTNIPNENLQEIYGVSHSFSSKYNYIASKYQRILNYHAAHDIGHALNDYSVVGCSAFGLKNNKTEDGKLLIGRNFDFFVGDDFAKEKLVLFMKPSRGIPFVSYAWAGFTGVASGLNIEGISVTINASKSDLPTSSKTPISLLAREILQYAHTIPQAVAIAKKRDVFVSETIMVSSAKENRIVLIEKSPSKTGVYESKEDQLICTNHYQSSTFKKDKVNIQNIQESDSKYRYNRIQKLLAHKNQFTLNDVVKVLRDQKNINEDTLGMGNPRAINQLIAHHSVIFQPSELTMFVSTKNFQLGKFIGYNLHTIFTTKKTDKYEIIKEDPFLKSVNYLKFKRFNKLKKQISNYLIFDNSLTLSKQEIKRFILDNSESYITYEMLGKYYAKKKLFANSTYYFNLALGKKLASNKVKNELKLLINENIKQSKN